MLFNIPLTVVSLIVYNIIAFGLLGSFPGNPDPWLAPVFTIEMISEARWTMTVGDLMITVAIVLLFIEVMKATRTTAGSVVDHILSTLVFVAFLVEFLTIGQAAHSVFFILMVIAFFDIVAGFAVTLGAARRDISWG